MKVDSDKLRAWVTAERIAVMAEEEVRTATRRHVQYGEPAPTEETMSAARERRAKADRLFREMQPEFKREPPDGNAGL